MAEYDFEITGTLGERMWQVKGKLGSDSPVELLTRIMQDVEQKFRKESQNSMDRIEVMHLVIYQVQETPTTLQ
jgi:hypothetical protein